MYLVPSLLTEQRRTSTHQNLAHDRALFPRCTLTLLPFVASLDEASTLGSPYEGKEEVPPQTAKASLAFSKYPTISFSALTFLVFLRTDQIHHFSLSFVPALQSTNTSSCTVISTSSKQASK